MQEFSPCLKSWFLPQFSHSIMSWKVTDKARINFHYLLSYNLTQLLSLTQTQTSTINLLQINGLINDELINSWYNHHKATGEQTSFIQFTLLMSLISDILLPPDTASGYLKNKTKQQQQHYSTRISIICMWSDMTSNVQCC